MRNEHRGHTRVLAFANDKGRWDNGGVPFPERGDLSPWLVMALKMGFTLGGALIGALISGIAVMTLPALVALALGLKMAVVGGALVAGAIGGYAAGS